MSDSIGLAFDRRILVHAIRTTVAAVASLAVARVLGLPEAQWAPITTLVVTQSTLGAAMTVSVQRLAGTALGAAAAILLGTYIGSGIWSFALGVFVLGLICGVLRLDHPAYRFAGITLAIIILVPRQHPLWIVAAHRFVEVSLGIAAGLAISAAWPEKA